MSKAEILNMPTIAYWSGLDGLEIKDIEHGINDYVLCVSGAWYGGKSNERAHRVKTVSYTHLTLPTKRIV